MLDYRLHAPEFAGEPLIVLSTPSKDGAELAIASAREDLQASARAGYEWSQ